MENFEEILKRELKPLKEDIRDIKNEVSSFKVDIDDKMTNFRSEIKDEMDNFKTEMKAEMTGFRKEIRQEVGDEIRERFFVFEQEYSKVIGAIHDNTLQMLQITARNSAETEVQKKKISDLQTKYLTHEDKINKIEKLIDSKVFPKKVGNLSSKV